MNSKKKKKCNLFLLKTNDSISNHSQQHDEDQNHSWSVEKDIDHISKSDSSNNIKTRDRYISHLINNEHINSIEQVNLLKFQLINLPELRKKMNILLFENHNHNHHQECLVLTSRQAVEAIESCLKLDNNNNDNNNNNNENSNINAESGENNCSGSRKVVVIYCVGEATKRRCETLLAKLAQNNSNIKCSFEIRSCHTNSTSSSSSSSSGPTHQQNAKSLANLIIEDHHDHQEKNKIESSNSISSSRRSFSVFYPCSAIRKDDLSNALLAAGVSLDELAVYETTICHTGLDHFRHLMEEELDREREREQEVSVVVLVFFSPSGCEAVFGLRLSGNETDDNGKKITTSLKQMIRKMMMIRGQRRMCELVSIGPSTTTRLNSLLVKDHDDDVNILVVHELSEPSPQSLADKLEAILTF